MNQISQFLRHPFVVNIWHKILCVQYSYLLSILKWVLEEAQRVEDTPQHPDIALGVDLVLEISVNHLWRTIHEGGVLLKLLNLLFQILRRAAARVQDAGTSRAKIAKFESFLVQ